MSEPVVVSIISRPTWYINAIGNIPDIEWRDVRKDRDVVHKWWKDRYGAYYTGNFELVFRNQEAYMECVLTWS